MRFIFKDVCNDVVRQCFCFVRCGNDDDGMLNY